MKIIWRTAWENITITDRSQLLSITLDQAKNCKFIRIKNLEIDWWCTFQITILCGWLAFYIFCRMQFCKGGVVRFELCSNSIRDRFYSLSIICWRSWTVAICTVSVSSNKSFGSYWKLIGDDPERFVKYLCKNVFNFKSLEKLVISENGFSSSIINILKEKSNSCVDEVVL